MDGTPPPSQQECDQANMNRWDELVGTFNCSKLDGKHYVLIEFDESKVIT